MKIACLQFSPELGNVEGNISRAETVLASEQDAAIDWLILPELAFTGYNFQSLEAITPFLEPTTSGPSTRWAQTTARRLQCHVTVGYPEKTIDEPIRRYNSIVTVSPDGTVLANYRKHFLYYTDETWADEGDAFYAGDLGMLGDVSMGICMDINPYKFTADWSDYEFANHVLASGSSLAVLSMAWITRLTMEELEDSFSRPDLETLAYWLERFQPLAEMVDDGPIFLVMANRCGQEGGVCYAGSSTVLSFDAGTIFCHDICGRMEEKVMIVDLSKPASYVLKHTSEIGE